MISVHDYLAQHGTGHEFEMTEEMQSGRNRPDLRGTYCSDRDAGGEA